MAWPWHQLPHPKFLISAGHQALPAVPVWPGLDSASSCSEGRRCLHWTLSLEFLLHICDLEEAERAHRLQKRPVAVALESLWTIVLMPPVEPDLVAWRQLGLLLAAATAYPCSHVLDDFYDARGGARIYPIRGAGARCKQSNRVRRQDAWATVNKSAGQVLSAEDATGAAAAASVVL